MDELDELFDEFEKQDKKSKSPWINKPLSGKKKPKLDLNFQRKKKKYKLEPVPRSEIIEPIRRNFYYTHLKESGADKDEILCGVNEETIKINKVLYDCFTVADLKSNERQMFQWVIANTTGHNRREVNLNVKQISEDIGRSPAFVYSSLNRLSEKK
jgi:hypothetical protein